MCDYAAAEANRLADELAQLKEDYGVVVVVAQKREAALAAMTDRADAESLRAERAEETALKLKPMWDDYGILIKDKERLQAKLEAVEHGNKVLTASRNDWMDKAIQKGKEWQVLQAKLEAVDSILAWLLDEQAECGNVLNADAVIRRLKQALGTTDSSLRERVEAVLAQWRGQHWIYTKGEVIRRTCIEEIEAAVKGE